MTAPHGFFQLTMTTSELRNSFREFAGLKRYSKFVRAIHRACRDKDRLLFWQEELWKNFVAIMPQAPQAQEQILAAFNVCDVHDCGLQPPPDDQPPLEIRDTPECNVATSLLFPFAINGNFVCVPCREARQKWIQENLDLCRILRRKTTYEDFCSRWFEGLVDNHEVKAKIQKRSAEIAALLEPGDELWEWDSGGWHRFAGSAGVAIVRSGNIVQKWREFRS